VQLFTLNGAKQLRILAKDVPAVGYRVYEVAPGAGKTYLLAATVNGGVIDNGARSRSRRTARSRASSTCASAAASCRRRRDCGSTTSAATVRAR
jgi:hypothetical protein